MARAVPSSWGLPRMLSRDRIHPAWCPNALLSRSRALLHHSQPGQTLPGSKHLWSWVLTASPEFGSR